MRLSWHLSWSRSTHGALHRLHTREGLTEREGRISGSRAAGEQPYYKGHPELHFLSQGHSEGFEQALPGYYSIADTNECQPAAAAATDR